MAIKHTKTAVPDVDKVDCTDWNANHTGTLNHLTELTNVTADQHHNEAHTLASHSSKDHSELTNVTSDQHHAQSHNAASHSDITSTGAQIDDAVSKKHSQNTDTDLDATFELTFVKKVDNVNVLADITSAGANIEDAVTKRHTQNTDTALGAQTQNLDMNTHKIVGVVDPTANQEAATKKYVDDTAAPTSPAGNDGEVQFNDAGSFGADANLFWDDTNKRLGIGTNTPSAKLEITGNLLFSAGANRRIFVGGESEIWGRDLSIEAGGTVLTYQDGGDLKLDGGSSVFGGDDGNVLINTVNLGNVGINKTDPKSKLAVVGLLIFANNAAAIAGGLTAGDFYRTNADPDPVCVVH